MFFSWNRKNLLLGSCPEENRVECFGLNGGGAREIANPCSSEEAVAARMGDDKNPWGWFVLEKGSCVPTWPWTDLANGLLASSFGGLRLQKYAGAPGLGIVRDWVIIGSLLLLTWFTFPKASSFTLLHQCFTASLHSTTHWETVSKHMTLQDITAHLNPTTAYPLYIHTSQ